VVHSASGAVRASFYFRINRNVRAVAVDWLHFRGYGVASARPASGGCRNDVRITSQLQLRNHRALGKRVMLSATTIDTYYFQ
jgi:hypothetical protein